MRRVFVVDANKTPLMPCLPNRARQLLKERKASVLKLYPFTIILKQREGGEVQKVEMNLNNRILKTVSYLPSKAV